MDEEVDPDNESVNGVLAQESSELFTILSSQSSTVIMKLLQMIPDEALRSINRPSTSAAATVEHIKTMLEYFSSACAVDCCNFLQSVCMLCENIPMHLESRLISVAGCEKCKFQAMLQMTDLLEYVRNPQSMTVQNTIQSQQQKCINLLISQIHHVYAESHALTTGLKRR